MPVGVTDVVIQDWAASTSGGSAVASLTQGWGVTPKPGSLLLCTSYCAQLFTTPPTGWTLLVDSVGPLPTDLPLWGKVAGSSEGSVTINAPSGTAPISMALCELGATGLSTPNSALDKSATNSTDNAVNTTAQTTGTTAATSQADEYAVAIWAGYNATTALNGGVWSGETNSFVEKVDVGTSRAAAFNSSLCVAVKRLSAAGTVESTATPAVTQGKAGLVATFFIVKVPSGSEVITSEHNRRRRLRAA